MFISGGVVKYQDKTCELCKGLGVVFVKTIRTDIKSLAMCCHCGSKENTWQLPIYNIDQVLISSPYRDLKGKVSWEKLTQYFIEHIKKSKKIWDGDI